MSKGKQLRLLNELIEAAKEVGYYDALGRECWEAGKEKARLKLATLYQEFKKTIGMDLFPKTFE